MERGLLGHVLRVGLRAEEPPVEAQHASVVPVEEQDEHPPLPGERQAHRLLAVGLVGLVAHTFTSRKEPKRLPGSVRDTRAGFTRKPTEPGGRGQVCGGVRVMLTAQTDVVGLLAKYVDDV